VCLGRIAAMSASITLANLPPPKDPVCKGTHASDFHCLNNGALPLHHYEKHATQVKDGEG